MTWATPQAMFLRFVIPDRHPKSGVRKGIFGAAYELRRGGDLTEGERQELDRLIDWFDDNLPRPSRFNRSKSKGYYHRAAKGISWLKSTAEEHLENMRALIGILEDQGHQVTMIKTLRPGYVVYEDDFQIVAEPFNDTTT